MDELGIIILILLLFFLFEGDPDAWDALTDYRDQEINRFYQK